MDPCLPTPPDDDLEALLQAPWSHDDVTATSWVLPDDAFSSEFLTDRGVFPQQTSSFSMDDMMLDVFNADNVSNEMEWTYSRSEPDTSTSVAQCKKRKVRKPRPKSISEMQFKFSTGRKAYVASQTGEVWESHKPELKRLYIHEDKTLKEIMSLMELKGFHASAKMYKTRFKQWGFVKNNNREDVAKMILVRQKRAAVGKQTTFERNGKVVQIDRYLKKHGIVLPNRNAIPTSKNELPGTVRCCTPPPEPFCTTPGFLSLKELLMRCLKDLSPSFARLYTSSSTKHKTTTSLWDAPRYLKLACDLFSENRHKQAGSICDSAFSSVHALVHEPRLDTLFNFLVSQLWWDNKDVTLELWRYLSAYMASVLGATGSAVYHLLRALVAHIETHGHNAYLDFMTECIDDILRLDESNMKKSKSWWKIDNHLVKWCQLIVMDCYFLNGFNPRADRIQARCASALPRSRMFPYARDLNEHMWRNAFAVYASSSSTALTLTQSPRHERFLRLAFTSYARVLGQASGTPVMHPSLTHIENVVNSLSRRSLEPAALTKCRGSLDLESRVLSFLTRDLSQGKGQPVDYGSYPV
ncbi:hypothetical protein G7054_g4215 [Neopestalotiopsis clavispora]|nr:hypothetical protein G7054_g4215 [Neopestalotiopsis clavispora]